MRIVVIGMCLGIALLLGMVGTEAKAETKQSESASWVERTKFHGDLRYRHESITAEGKSDRSRHRIRIRVGIDAKVNETVNVGFQIASGSSDPVSTNQTLDGGFSSKSILIDLAYFDWHPDSWSGLHVIGGRMKNPFYRPKKSELVWDGDLRPEGGAIRYSTTNGNWGFFTNLGGFWLDERSGGADTGLLGAQAGLKHSFTAGHLLVGGSYYDYVNMKGESPLFDATDSFGNTVDADGNYSFDYDVFESFAELGFKISGVPVTLYGDFVKNLASEPTENQGWSTGAAIGKCKAPYSWSFRYIYRDIEADALPGVFTDSDFIGGGTDGRGHEMGFSFQVARNWKTGVSYFSNERQPSTAKSDYQRLQLDMAFKF